MLNEIVRQAHAAPRLHSFKRQAEPEPEGLEPMAPVPEP